MEEHFAECPHCESVRDGMRNVIELYGDKTMFTLPASFHPRLHGRLADRIEGRRGSSLGWLLGIAATAAFAALTLLASVHDRSLPQPRAQRTQPARRLPQLLCGPVAGAKNI